MAEEYFELNFVLVTCKGSRYNAGSVNLSISECLGHEGKTMRRGLNRCIDKEADCGIKVVSVKNSNPKSHTLKNSSLNVSKNSAFTPAQEHKRNSFNPNETKSEHSFSLY